jgi:hypothetical protein
MSDGFACNISALNAEERSRHGDLLARLRVATQNVQELDGGYSFHLRDSGFTLIEAAEWISLERRCCSFFNFQLEVSGGDDSAVLTLTGPDGVKPFINSALR